MFNIITERLLIRELEDSDIEPLYTLLSDPVVMQYCSGALDFEASQKWLDAVKRYYRQYGYDYWAVCDKATGAFIGQMGIIKQEVDGEWLNCIAFMIRVDQWGKGYSTEGATACIKYAFEALKMDKLYATVEPENSASMAILKKMGMQYEREAECFDQRVFLYSLGV